MHSRKDIEHIISEFETYRSYSRPLPALEVAIFVEETFDITIPEEDLTDQNLASEQLLMYVLTSLGYEAIS